MRSSSTVSVLLVRPLIAALGNPGPGLAALFAATDLTPEMVADADVRITSAQLSVAWSELVRLSGDRQVALKIAASIPPGVFGIVEYVCRSAPTLGEALQRWVRYLNLLDDGVEVALVSEGDRAFVRVVQESEAPAAQAHELCFAILADQARKLSRVPFRPLAVEFTHRVPGDAAGYRAWFDAPVRFSAEQTQLVLAQNALEAPLVSADPHLLEILSRHADDLAARDAKAPSMIGAVKRILRSMLRDEEGHIEPVARRLGLTARSLQRRLKEEGASFNSVREEVRRELARRYLDEGLSIAEISFLLGFSEPSAFFRAFKRWTGKTPLESRPQRRALLPA